MHNPRVRYKNTVSEPLCQAALNNRVGSSPDKIDFQYMFLLLSPSLTWCPLGVVHSSTLRATLSAPSCSTYALRVPCPLSSPTLLSYPSSRVPSPASRLSSPVSPLPSPLSLLLCNPVYLLFLFPLPFRPTLSSDLSLSWRSSPFLSQPGVVEVRRRPRADGATAVVLSPEMQPVEHEGGIRVSGRFRSLPSTSRSVANG